MAEKPNVTVIYQDAKPSGDNFSSMITQLLAAAVIIGMIVLFSSCGVAWWLW